MTATPVSTGPGVIVLAAYRPDPELFAIQLRSIRDQTRRDFRCLIGADGGQEEVRALVTEIVGDDSRFEVIGWDDNLGFYLNFERLLIAVSPDAAWVALSDQDDRWHPDKLERLLPLLDSAVLATGQARVVSWPDEQVVLDRTSRRVVPAGDLLFENQVTGSLSVFRRELLDLALPFPRLHTVTQLHDHWLAMCAVSGNGYLVHDEVVQDYVQHEHNVVGGLAGHRSVSPVAFVKQVVLLADSYEGGHSVTQCARACQVQSFEWRRVMLRELGRRVVRLPASLEGARRDLGSANPLPIIRLLGRAARSPEVSPWVVATFLPGIPAELTRRWAARASRPSPLGPLD